MDALRREKSSLSGKLSADDCYKVIEAVLEDSFIRIARHGLTDGAGLQFQKLAQRQPDRLFLCFVIIIILFLFLLNFIMYFLFRLGGSTRQRLACFLQSCMRFVAQSGVFPCLFCMIIK